MQDNYMTPQMAYEGYYAVRRETLDRGGIFEGVNFNTITAESSMTAAEILDIFIGTLKQLIAFESQKEREYLTKFYEKYKSDPELANELYNYLFSTPTNLSKAFEITELYRYKLKEEVDNLELNLGQMRDMLMTFNNKFIMETSQEAVYSLDNILTMTPQQILDYIIKYIREKYADTKYQTNFDSFMNAYEPELVNVVKNMKGFRKKGDWTKPINTINFGKKATSKEQLQEDYISKVIRGLFNGLGQEQFLVGFTGASTGRVKQKVKYFPKSKTTVGAIETDIIGVLTNDFEIDRNAIDAINSIQTNEELRQLINTSPKDDFIIHYSSKDLSIAEDSNKSSVLAKLKGEGSFNAKIPILEDLGTTIGKRGEMHELIFEAINSGASLIYDDNGNIDDVARAITSLTFAFMFEDFNEQIRQIDDIQTAKELHIYMITGQYFTISDILTVLLQQVMSWKSSPNRFINIRFKPAPTSYYEQFRETRPAGLDRWNAVREATIKNTLMSTYMNVTHLRDALNMALRG